MSDLSPDAVRVALALESTTSRNNVCATTTSSLPFAARDGLPLPPGRALAKPKCESFDTGGPAVRVWTVNFKCA